MGPGRPRKPTKMKALEGNPGRRALTANEVQPLGVARRPAFVKGNAAKEWDRTIAAMPPGFYTQADEPVLTIYCMALALYLEALKLVAKEGMTDVGSMGQKTAHPALAIASKQAEIMMRAADRLGMSPVARTRLTVPENKPKSKFEGLLGGTPAKTGTSPVKH